MFEQVHSSSLELKWWAERTMRGGEEQLMTSADTDSLSSWSTPADAPVSTYSLDSRACNVQSNNSWASSKLMSIHQNSLGIQTNALEMSFKMLMVLVLQSVWCP